MSAWLHIASGDYPLSERDVRARIVRSLPGAAAELAEALAELGYAPVTETPRPDDVTAIVTEVPPELVDGAWRQVWLATPRSSEEAAAALARVRAEAMAEIDRQAEAARLQYVTPGSGQALEYERTEREARAFAAAGFAGWDPALYPMVEAERQAIADAGEEIPAPRAAAEAVIAQADAWAGVGAAIKRLRRARKMRLAGATTGAEVAAILAEGW